MNNVVSLSGGKDSTAMLLAMLAKGESIHSIVFFDTGWEFPAMCDHLDKLEMHIGMEIVRLKPDRPFDYYLAEHPVVGRRNDQYKGKVKRIGYGWPWMKARWCTRLKITALDKYSSQITDVAQCVGIAADEEERVFTHPKKIIRFPLIEYGMTEDDCLKYCQDRGFDWDGLYKSFRRVSCFCCPLQRIGELRTLWRDYPELWERMLDMERSMARHTHPHPTRFMRTKSVSDMGRRFTDAEAREELKGANDDNSD